MADFSIDDLWWLKQEKPQSSVPALALGAQIVQRRADSIRQAEQLKTSNAMQMMGLMLERERNDIALQTFRTKQASDLLRTRGMAEIGEFLGAATANNKLTDPETQAEFWRKTSRLAPFLPEAAVNSMWDNTFKPAMDRQARAEGKGDATVTERDMAQWKLLVQAEQEATNDDVKRNAKVERQMFERMKGVGDIASGPPQRDVDFGISKVGESEQIWLRNPKTGALSFRAMPKTGINATDQQKIEYVSRVKALQDAFDDRQLKAPDGTRADFNEYQRQLDKLNEEFRTKATGPTAPAATGTNDPPADPLGLFSK